MLMVASLAACSLIGCAKPKVEFVGSTEREQPADHPVIVERTRSDEQTVDRNVAIPESLELSPDNPSAVDEMASIEPHEIATAASSPQDPEVSGTERPAVFTAMWNAVERAMTARPEEPMEYHPSQEDVLNYFPQGQ